MELKTGEKYTMIGISEFMAHTYRRELTIKGKNNDRYIFSEKGKRKQFLFPEKLKDIAIFEGWDLPFKVDSDTGSFCGNALVNMVGDEKVIKDYFDNKQLNPDFKKDVVVLVGEKDSRKVLYPEIAKDSGHAVIMEIMNE